MTNPMGSQRNKTGVTPDALRRKAAVLAGAALVLFGCRPAEPSSGPGDPFLQSGPEASQAFSEFAEARGRMVEEVAAWGISNTDVLEAIGRVPRHEFVPAEYLGEAYENHPLPIGYGQTISQPYIVALMTDELQIKAGDTALEIGTGSGYQAAVLAELGVEVYTIEIIGALAEAAAERLERLGYSGVHVRHADGYFGWETAGPFQHIIITAAPDHIPQPLLDQLAPGGVMVLPIGPPGGYQELWRLERNASGEVTATSLGGVRFVPLIREDDPP